MWVSSKVLALVGGLLCSSFSMAQNQCADGIRVEGIITDPTGAVIPGVRVRASSGERAITDAAGHYVLPCVQATSTTITAQADGFASGAAPLERSLAEVTHVNLQLAVASVETDVQVQEDATAADGGHGMGTITLNTQQVQQLAGDPDDFLRELQALASVSGGDPGSAMIRVDGFQNGSALPPKGSIASIRVAPDLFSAEYQFPPFGGAQIEILTKPGADKLHGALFFTDSNSIFNANDPFSVTATPAGKQRYGFELTGPILSKRSGFVLALEKRNIDEFNVVNAKTLDSNGNLTPLKQSIAAPQRLWIVSGRVDWQVTPKDVAALSFSSNISKLSGQGVGGLTIADAGYSSLLSEYDLRLTNTQTLSANALHQARIGYTWKRTEQTPQSTTPSLQVAGFFTGGGSTAGHLNDRERDLEVDDDLMFTHGKHEVKVGVQSLGIFIHDYDPNTFNGAYLFGGGSGPVLDANNNPTSETETIKPIDQYRRALLHLPGGTPTTYQVTSGTPVVPLTQWQLGWYAQDDVKLTPRLTLSAGLRYSFQTTPNNFANFGPRVGLGWAVDKKEAWVFHLRAGLFSHVLSPSYATEVYRLNGVRQRQMTVYSPDYDNPLSPVAGSVEINTVNQFPRSSLMQVLTFAGNLDAEHDFAHHWHADVGFYWGQDSNTVRVRNINAPMITSCTECSVDPTSVLRAPRPIAPDENILEYQNSGHLGGQSMWFSMGQHSYKRFGFSAWYVHYHFKSDGGNGVPSPQSSYSDRGESARADWLSPHRVGAIGNLNLPLRLELSGQFDAVAGHPYNITTGTDNNGDGSFNDRPTYASALGEGVYSTRFGLLSINTINGNVPRNLGTVPAIVHLDMNLKRSFVLNPKDKNHPRTLDFNARSANLLNHTDITAVNTVLSSGSLGQPLSAEVARRVEFGARFSF